jgi:hypothetical protein
MDVERTVCKCSQSGTYLFISHTFYKSLKDLKHLMDTEEVNKIN